MFTVGRSACGDDFAMRMQEMQERTDCGDVIRRNLMAGGELEEALRQ